MCEFCGLTIQASRIMSEQTANSYYMRQWYNYVIIMDITSWTSFLMGLFMLFVMIKMQIYKSRLLRMVVHLFVLQLIYVTAYFSIISPKPGSADPDDYNEYSSYVIGYAYVVAIGGGFITNFIMMTLSYVLITGKAAQPSQTLYWFLVVVPGLVLGVMANIFFYLEMYDYFRPVAFTYNSLRLLQVGINVMAVSLLYYRVGLMSRGAKTSEVFAFRQLAFRLVGYPIAGAIQRLSCSLYTFYAGASAQHFAYNVEAIDAEPHKNATTLIVFLYIWAFLAPSLIIMDTVIFLYFQKGALDCCKFYLLYAANIVTCGYVQVIDTPDELLDTERHEGSEVFVQGLVGRNRSKSSRHSRRSLSIGTVELGSARRNSTRASVVEAMSNMLVRGEFDPEKRDEAMKELAPSELMDMIVRVRKSEIAASIRASERESTATDSQDPNRGTLDSESGEVGEMEEDDEIPRGSSMRESNAVFLLDYIMETSDEPGVSPEEATRKRKEQKDEVKREQVLKEVGSKGRMSSVNPIHEDLQGEDGEREEEECDIV